MDTGLQDSLRNLYRQGVERGLRQGRVDKLGLRVSLVCVGWLAGVVTGLMITGWL